MIDDEFSGILDKQFKNKKNLITQMSHNELPIFNFISS